MKQTKSIFDNRYWILFLAIFCIGVVAFCGIYGQTSVSEQFLFILSQIAFVLIPGMALVLLICPPKHTLSLLIVSYMMGVALVIAQYYLFYAIGLKDLIVLPMSILSLLSVWVLYKKRSRFQEIKQNNQDMWALSALLAALIVLVLFSAIVPSSVPNAATQPYATYYQDMLWNTGNTTSIANGLPVMDLHVEGLTFSYHYFTSVFLAVFKNILNVSSVFLNFKMLPILQIILYAGALYLLFSLVTKKIGLRVLLVCITVFSSLILLQHLLFFAYATAFSLAFTVLCAYFFIKYIKNMEQCKVGDKNFLLFLIFFAVAVGTKTLFAGVFMAGAGILFLYQIIRRKNTKIMFIHGLLMVAVVGVLYLAMVYGTHGYNGLQVAFGTPMTMQGQIYFEPLVANLQLAKILSYPLYLIRNHTMMVTAIVLLLVFVFKSTDKKLPILLLSMTVVGLAMASVLYQPGLSNILFIEATTPFCVFAVFWCAKQIHNSKSLKKGLKIGLLCVVVAATVFGVTTVSRQIAATAQNQVVRSQNINPNDGISAYEYEGMQWLKQNTPKDAVIAADRYYFIEGENPAFARYYYYSAFSERQFYIEGYNYINTYQKDFQKIIDTRLATMKAVYAGDDAAIAQLKADGVAYLISSTFATPEFVLPAQYGEPVFKNEGITIYRLN
ncbi:MAG: hypothetical protein RSC60_01260 [Christensenellaceae bacterium]